MHDIEHMPSRDDSTVEITDIPRQEEQQVAPDSGTTPMTSRRRNSLIDARCDLQCCVVW